MFVLGRATAEPALPPPPEQTVTVTSGPGITPSSFASFTFSGGGELRVSTRPARHVIRTVLAHSCADILLEGEHVLEVPRPERNDDHDLSLDDLVPPGVEITRRTTSPASIQMSPSRSPRQRWCRHLPVPTRRRTLFALCLRPIAAIRRIATTQARTRSRTRTVETERACAAAIRAWLVRAPPVPVAGPSSGSRPRPRITTSFSAQFTFSGATSLRAGSTDRAFERAHRVSRFESSPHP